MVWISHPASIGWVALSSLVVCPASTKVILLSPRLLSECFQSAFGEQKSACLLIIFFATIDMVNLKFLQHQKHNYTKTTHFYVIVKTMFLSPKFANTHSMKELRVSFALPKSTPTPVPGCYDHQLCQSRKTDQQTFAWSFWSIQLATNSFKLYYEGFYLCSQLSIICTTDLNCVGM